MRSLRLGNEAKKEIKKVGRKETLPVTLPSSEEVLNTLTDIIIERLLEDRKTNKTTP